MMHRLARKIVAEGWTARRVEDEVARLTDPAPTARKGGAKQDPNVKRLEERLRARFTTKVSVQHGQKGTGKVTFNYANLEELERLLDLWKIKS